MQRSHNVSYRRNADSSGHVIRRYRDLLQAKTLPRLEKSALFEKALPAHSSKKDISLYIEYTDTPGLSNNRIRLWFASLSQSILIRYAFGEFIFF